ncbi:MAG: hypothetical protein JHC98_11515 [Thermoleophilaceae bacterium]|nr:hypothetical protein [Thermoleophilaceae bacterium]
MTPPITTDADLRTASSPPAVPGVELPLIEWGNLALRAGRVGTNYPHMAWLQRFDGSVSIDDLEAEARRIGTNPYAFGRRLKKSRFPGGRMRWTQVANVAPVEFNSEPVEDWRAWVDSVLGRRLDPERDHGWAMLACETTDGDTIVLVLMHHLYGTARGIMDACFNSAEHDPLTGSTGFTFTHEYDYSAFAELRGIWDRIRLGFVGLGMALRAIPIAIKKARSAPKAAAPGLPTPLRAARGSDPTRKDLSPDRVYACYRAPAAEVEAAAAAFGGSSNTLLTAITANMLRRARIARGGPVDRNLQLVIPMDIPEEQKRHKLANIGKEPGTEDLLITAALVLPGGAPAHTELGQTKARTKEAYIADSLTPTAMRGANDVARFFPERLTYFFAAKAATAFDGCASNVGELPENFRFLGEHEAVETEMIGFPIGNELMSALTRSGGDIAMAFMTDPARMGDNTDLRQWLAEELAAWGIS